MKNARTSSGWCNYEPAGCCFSLSVGVHPRVPLLRVGEDRVPLTHLLLLNRRNLVEG